MMDFLIEFENEFTWSELVDTAIGAKSAIVNRDFTEKNIREILNFGHTIGHAFESLSLSFLGKHLSHGHAIGLGMICESFMSVIKSGLDIGDRDSIIDIVLTHFKYFPLQDKDVDLMMNFMAYDKKRRKSGLRLSLLQSPGNAVPGIICTPEEILESINFYRSIGEESEAS
jgi:3-dehydroquinate synthase